MRLSVLLAVTLLACDEVDPGALDAGIDAAPAIDARDCRTERCSCDPNVECVPGAPCDSGCPDDWTCEPYWDPEQGLVGFCEER